MLLPVQHAVLAHPGQTTALIREIKFPALSMITRNRLQGVVASQWDTLKTERHNSIIHADWIVDQHPDVGMDQERMIIIETKEALNRAYQHALEQLKCGKIGNITAEPAGEVYLVEFRELPRPSSSDDFKAGRCIIKIHSESGAVVESRRVEMEKSPYADLTTQRAEEILDGMKAYEASLAALKGYETYDKCGKLTIELRGPNGANYAVTFPLKPEEMEDPRAADYAYQVIIDAETGAVTKILMAS
jgi:hypothetical protein